ncbi:MAG: MBL fold metallo-hydrolase [Chitinophaga sp.]|uniref:MBL fold metallo-hydrolase n=1 Tax=Chitinophaga sp. TaxID=1869181 RepID=UPI001B283038|nr:MBL fold metallo-hydrolase [Chitinophaga sp.]MBO9733004.1 MBL fold metallo-hydrolase [Chitinophaga sp.]
MKIKQFEDIGLAQYGYAISNEAERTMVLIDPARDMAPYLAYAAEEQATIVGVIETHPHADFVSSHLALHQQTGATIYCSRLVGAAYPHQSFDDGDEIVLGNIRLKAVNTPGHSPDSISIVLEEEGRNKAVFTGDTLFVGDCGRPDLRENVGNITAKRTELAKQMYDSLHNKLMLLEDDVLVYPAHGAGTLCGKSLGKEKYSTIGIEKVNNWSLQEMSVDVFVSALTEGQPFIPAYFPYDVDLNKRGAEDQVHTIARVPRGAQGTPDENVVVIDTRAEAAFKEHHLPGALNLQNGGKFETWLGSIITPGEPFYLVAANREILEELIVRTAKIGYEAFIAKAFVFEDGKESMVPINVEDFATNLSGYTIVDVRNGSEVKEHRFFDQALAIPLPELRQRVAEIPLDKPIVVHCAGGYRSAAGSSIIQAAVGNSVKVFDLGENIKRFQ